MGWLRLMVVVLIALCAPASWAQEAATSDVGVWSDPAWSPDQRQWRIKYTAQLQGGDTLVVRAEHNEGMHSYAFDNDKRGGNKPNTSIDVTGSLKTVGSWQVPSPHESKDATGTDWAYDGTVYFSVKVERAGDGAATLAFKGMVCNDKGCLPINPKKTRIVMDPTKHIGPRGAMSVTPHEAMPAPKIDEKPKVEEKPDGAKSGLGVTGKLIPQEKNWWVMNPWAGQTVSGTKDLVDFILFCVAGGLIALLMPCVFPMIPITISYFGKQAEATGKPTGGLALVYGIGIILSYTGIGFLLTFLLGASGVSEFGNNTWVAVGLAVFFLIFALSMFGMFELRLPSGIAQKFNLQGKAGGVGGAFLLGTTFAVTSMACTVPVVGMILAIAATGEDYFRPTIGMLVYAATVAAPFVILAAVPGLLKKMPRAGGWMNAVKIVFGFIELAAAAEFLGWARIVSREAVLAIWIACFLLSALYLLGVFRSSHDVQSEGIGGSRMLFTTVFLSVALWLSTGLFGEKLGFIESFLRGKEAADWTINPDLEKALADAREARKPVILDFTGPS